MELAPRHKFLRNVAASDILKFRVSGVMWHFLGFSRGILHHRGCHVVSSEYAQRLGTMPSKRLSKCPPFNVSQI